MSSTQKDSSIHQGKTRLTKTSCLDFDTFFRFGKLNTSIDDDDGMMSLLHENFEIHISRTLYCRRHCFV
jgi:hypothetical protein